MAQIKQGDLEQLVFAVSSFSSPFNYPFSLLSFTPL